LDTSIGLLAKQNHTPNYFKGILKILCDRKE
jgi:hypothetical protein